jgi:hypothetical protein
LQNLQPQTFVDVVLAWFRLAEKAHTLTSR